MTTPDPDRKSAPFEWRALTINKVEKIQLARLHKEQDRIEKELRQQEALEREARRLEAEEREREAAEQAWFDQGSEQPRDALEERDTQREAAVFTPLKRLSHSLTAFARRLTHPAPKPRTSVPPPPLNDSPVSLSLVLAACAFGGSVYLSLRWVAEVRQANVTQQLSSSVNATAPAASSPVAQRPNVALLSPPVATLPFRATSTTPSPVAPTPQSLVQNNTATVNVATPATTAALDLANSRSALTPSSPLSKGARAFTAAPAPLVQPTVADTEGTGRMPVDPALPPSVSQPAGRSRVLVPASGSPHSSGTRVYRGGE